MQLKEKILITQYFVSHSLSNTGQFNNAVYSLLFTILWLPFWKRESLSYCYGLSLFLLYSAIFIRCRYLSFCSLDIAFLLAVRLTFYYMFCHSYKIRDVIFWNIKIHFVNSGFYSNKPSKIFRAFMTVQCRCGSCYGGTKYRQAVLLTFRTSLLSPSSRRNDYSMVPVDSYEISTLKVCFM